MKQPATNKLAVFEYSNYEKIVFFCLPILYSD